MKKVSYPTITIVKTVFIFILMVCGFALLIFHTNFFLIAFAAIFFAVLLNYTAQWLCDKLNFKYWLALLTVLAVIAGLIAAFVIFLGPSISNQVSEMIDTLPDTLKNFKERVTKTPLGQKIFDKIPDDPSELIKDEQALFSKAMGSFSTLIGAIANFVIILISGIFLAANPGIYKKGFISLFPVDFRPRLNEVMDKTQKNLSLWMGAKLISMAVVGIASLIGLQLLNIPLPYALALIAALFSFIPNIGPYIALAPAVLIALLEGPEKALYVVILYFGIQIVESYAITPLIEKKLVSLPPGLTLLWMVLMGVLTGILGLILATPILAALIVIINELYVKDFLEKDKSV